MQPMRPTFASLLVLSLLGMSQLPAAPIVYKLTGYAQGTFSGQNFNAAFTFVMNADTSGVVQGPVVSSNAAVTSFITINGVVQNLPLVNIRIGLATSTGLVSLGTPTVGLQLTSPALQTWNLATSIGPVNGLNAIVKGSLNTTAGGVINFTGVDATAGAASPTFKALLNPPTITSVQNAASNILAGMPNGGIAQGAIFVIKGSGLGPSQISIADSPFQNTTLSNTSIAVKVGSATVNPRMYYTSDGQVAALLPSNTPTGVATFTVTYNGQTSNAANQTIVVNNPALFTLDSSGQGLGIVTYPDYSLVSSIKGTPCGGPNTACGAANPGDTLILWATGLGPITGDDSKGAGLGQNMPNIPLTLWFGGVKAPVIYQGRSGCCVGEDQLAFTVPDNVPLGCSVPLVIQIGNVVSNSVRIPIAKGSRTCSTGIPDADKAFTQLSLPFVFGEVDLNKGPNNSFTGQSDSVDVEFDKVLDAKPQYGPFALSFIGEDATYGTCIAFSTVERPNNEGEFVLSATDAKAGTSFTYTGPAGSKTLTLVNGQEVTVDANGKFIVPGDFTATGNGGADVGPFTAKITVPPSPRLTSPLGAAGLTVTRANGLTVNWTGGDPRGFVIINLTSALDQNMTIGGRVTCQASADAGTLTIPPYVLMALPAGKNTSFEFTPRATSTFTAQGLNFGVFNFFDFNPSNFVGNLTVN